MMVMMRVYVKRKYVSLLSLILVLVKFDYYIVIVREYIFFVKEWFF